jgi:hypothetical protein
MQIHGKIANVHGLERVNIVKSYHSTQSDLQIQCYSSQNSNDTLTEVKKENQLWN